MLLRPARQFHVDFFIASFPWIAPVPESCGRSERDDGGPPLPLPRPRPSPVREPPVGADVAERLPAHADFLLATLAAASDVLAVVVLADVKVHVQLLAPGLPQGLGPAPPLAAVN